MLSILLNGSSTTLPLDTTVERLVKSMCESPKGIAVARNSEVVPRSEWARTVLDAGDRVEIVSAAPGG